MCDHCIPAPTVYDFNGALWLVDHNHNISEVSERPENAMLYRMADNYNIATACAHRGIPLHNGVYRALSLADRHCDGNAPKYSEMMLRLLVELPRISEDGQRVAYWRNVANARADRATVTTLGKYLTRVCSAHVPSWAITKAVDEWMAPFCPPEYRLAENPTEMIRVLGECPDGAGHGAGSCMTDRDNLDWDNHPYRVYSSEYGWKMAWTKHNGEITSRGMVLENGTDKCFVRTYGDRKDVLASHLIATGYAQVGHWPETARIKMFSDRIAPYIDGSVRYVDSQGYIRLGGTFLADSTDGYFDGYGQCQCDDCGDHYTQSDMTEIGDCWYCDSCRDDNYIEISDTWYHKDDVSYCECCEEHVINEDMRTVHGGEWGEVCESCRSREYTRIRVDRCWEYHPDEDISHCEECGDEYLTDGHKAKTCLCPDCHSDVRLFLSRRTITLSRIPSWKGRVCA